MKTQGQFFSDRDPEPPRGLPDLDLGKGALATIRSYLVCSFIPRKGNFRIPLSLRAGLDLGKHFQIETRWFQRRLRGIVVSFIQASI